jgi:hypothetical protein
MQEDVGLSRALGFSIGPTPDKDGSKTESIRESIIQEIEDDLQRMVEN